MSRPIEQSPAAPASQPDIAVDISGWPGQTPHQLETLAENLPEARGFVVYPGNPALAGVTRELQGEGRAAILNDTELVPQAADGSIWRKPEELAVHGIQFVIKPFSMYARSQALLPDTGLSRWGMKTITTLTPLEWREFSGAQGGKPQDVNVMARLMAAESAASNDDEVSRVLLPEGDDLWTRQLRLSLIRSGDMVYFRNVPKPIGQRILEENPKLGVRAIVGLAGGAERTDDPVGRTIREARRVAEVLKNIRLQPSGAQSEPARKPRPYGRPMTADELRALAETMRSFDRLL